jgi:hypothetical protein
MLYLVIKAGLSGIIVAIVSEVAKRWPGWGGMIASLPLVSVLAMIWLWRDTGDKMRLAAQAEATFWFVIPSQPMFLLIPWMLRRDWPFPAALAAGCALTILLYALTLWVGPRLGLRL